MDEDEQKPKETHKKSPDKLSIGIPLKLVPNDKETLEEALRDLFDEDKVVHRQGNSEPEAD